MVCPMRSVFPSACPWVSPVILMLCLPEHPIHAEHTTGGKWADSAALICLWYLLKFSSHNKGCRGEAGKPSGLLISRPTHKATCAQKWHRSLKLLQRRADERVRLEKRTQLSQASRKEPFSAQGASSVSAWTIFSKTMPPSKWHTPEKGLLYKQLPATPRQ